MDIPEACLALKNFLSAFEDRAIYAPEAIVLFSRVVMTQSDSFDC